MNPDLAAGSNGVPLTAPRTPRVLLVVIPLLAVVGMVVLAALGRERGTGPLALLASPTVNGTAVALVVQPATARAVRDFERHQLHSQACVCDAGVSSTVDGPAFVAEAATLRALQTSGRHRELLQRRWRLGAIHAVDATSGVAHASEQSSALLYRGAVPVQRITVSVATRYGTLRTDRGWRVETVQRTVLSHTVTALPAVPPLSAAAVYLYDDTAGRGLYAYHANDPRPMASTTKMMTALVADRYLNLAGVVTVPADAMSVGAAVGGTIAGLYPGERMRVRDLFYGMLLPSGNDAAETLADVTAGSVPAFARLMNARAAALGLTHSHFVVPHGLDTVGQYSSARDLAITAHAVLQNPFLAAVVGTKSYSATSADARTRYTWGNLNKLLWTYPGAVGVKTGTTPYAGASVVAAAVRGHTRLIAVVLGDSKLERFADAARLLDYGWKLVGSGAT